MSKTGATLLSASDLHRVHKSSKMPNFDKRSSLSGGGSSSKKASILGARTRSEDRTGSISSGSGSRKGWRPPRKDSTAVGQAASLAAVALLLNTNRPVSDPEAGGSTCYHSEPERLSNYRASVAYMDEEIETLLVQRRRSSKFSDSGRHSSENNSPSRTSRSSSIRITSRSVLPRPPAKSNSPLNSTDCVLDEMSSQVQRLGSYKLFNFKRSDTSTASFKRKMFLQSNGGSSIVQHNHNSISFDPEIAKRLSLDERSEAMDAMTCIATSNYSNSLKRSFSTDALVPNSFCHDPDAADSKLVYSMNPSSESPRAMILDVGGRRHKVLESNFNIYPNTRLGKLVHARTEDEVLNLCDGFKPGDIPEYFFDRNWHSFNSILDIYRTGVLHLNTDLCALVLQKDLEYWQIDELILEPCCALKYYPEIEICVKEQKGEQEAKRKEAQRLEDENFGTHLLGRIRTYLWNLFEYPETSKQAQIMAFTSLGVVLISTLTFVLGTFPEFQTFEESGTPEEYPEAVFAMAMIDNVLVGFFVIEYVIRFACAPRKFAFFIGPMNLVDLFAIIPFFLDLIIGGLQDFQIMGKAGKIVRLVRVMRIMRIFKLVRHFAGLQSLIYTLNQAYKELGLLMLLVGVAVLTFASLVYFAEKDNPKGSWSFLDSFWWGLMTLTTVGYGDLSPSTFPGKLIGGLCALGGIFILTLPIPIVVNSFASYYKNRLWRNEVAYKKRQRAKKRREMELLMRDNLLNILTVPVDICGGGRQGQGGDHGIDALDDENDMLAVQSRIAMAERIAKGDDPGVVRTSFFDDTTTTPSTSHYSNDKQLSSLWSRIFGKRGTDKQQGRSTSATTATFRPSKDAATAAEAPQSSATRQATQRTFECEVVHASTSITSPLTRSSGRGPVLL